MSSSAGTLITDLDSSSPVTDNDIVAQMLADMNGGAPVQQQQQAPPPQMQQASALPPAPSGRHMMNAGPAPNSILANTIDPNVATAHLIGNNQPSPADFAMLMNQVQMGHQYQQPHQGYYMPQADSATIKAAGGSSFFSDNWLREFKTPILVAIIFCLMSMPVINVMIGHYFPRLLRIGGDLTMLGLAVKSIMAGAAFFIIQRVFVPLVTY
jgi:hypothetical protein